MKLFLFFFVANVIAVFSQTTIPSYFPTRCFIDTPTILLSKQEHQPKSSQEALAKEVMGWHPYWASANAHKNYDYTVLNHLSYFGYELKNDGTISSYQSSTPDDSVIAYAKEQGCRTSITIICFDPNDFVAMYEDYDKTELFFQQLADIVERLEVDEVCFDFEPLANFPQDMIRDFLLEARFALYFLPSAEEIKLSMAMPAVDWSNNFNFKHYAEDLDKLIVMAYDYHYTNSPNAGPVAPLTGENYSVSKTIENYLLDVPKEKLIIAVPWYGYDWPVTNTQRKATTNGAATSRSIAAMQPFVQQSTPTFDVTTKVPWLNYMQAQQQRQVWYEDSISLGYKYLEIAKNDLAGVGIWALSYAGNQQYAWSEIRTQFERTITTVAANVQSVEFKAVYIQTTSEQTITLTNTGNFELLISNISILGSDADVYSIIEGKPSSTPISVAPNATTTFKIQFAPLEVKTYNNATISVVSNASENLTIPVSGEGAPVTSVRNISADGNFGIRLIGQNPISSISSLEFSNVSGVKGEAEITIVDASGATVQSLGTVQLGIEKTTVPFSVANLASGAYTIVTKMNGALYTIPIRVAR